MGASCCNAHVATHHLMGSTNPGGGVHPTLHDGDGGIATAGRGEGFRKSQNEQFCWVLCNAIIIHPKQRPLSWCKVI